MEKEGKKPLSFHIEIRERPDDLLICIVLALLLIALVIFFPDSLARKILGLIFVLFLPGYAATAALFPENDQIDGIERVALTFGLSIAIVPLIGLALNFTPWGIRLDPILASVSGFIVFASLVGGTGGIGCLSTSGSRSLWTPSSTSLGCLWSTRL